MNYFEKKSSRTFIRSGVVVLIVLLFLAVVEFIWPQSFSWVRQGAVYTAKPITERIWNSSENKSDLERLMQENKILRQTLDSIVYDFVDYKNLKDENTKLKSALSFFDKNSFIQIPAKVIGKKVIQDKTFIIIDRGTSDGVEPGLPIVVGEGMLLGIVSHSDSDISYIIPIEENTSALSARILGKDGIVHGVIETTPGVATHLKLIPKSVELQPGDIIVTSAFNDLIPENIVIGSIERIDNKVNNFFQSAVVYFLVKYYDYSTVYVIKQTISTDED